MNGDMPICYWDGCEKAGVNRLRVIGKEGEHVHYEHYCDYHATKMDGRQYVLDVPSEGEVCLRATYGQEGLRDG